MKIAIDSFGHIFVIDIKLIFKKKKFFIFIIFWIFFFNLNISIINEHSKCEKKIMISYLSRWINSSEILWIYMNVNECTCKWMHRIYIEAVIFLNSLRYPHMVVDFWIKIIDNQSVKTLHILYISNCSFIKFLNFWSIYTTI